jgi:aminopeptidase YwaD
VPIWDGLTSRNVIGEYGAGDVIVIGAHVDTVATSPGANDNASGVATLIELARYFAGVETGCCLRFIAFGAEEGQYRGGRSVKGTGRAGSWHYAKSLDEQELGRIKLMVNLDMIGAGPRLEIGDLTDGGGEPARACTRIGRDLNIYCRLSKFGGKADYRPFSDMGRPVVAFAWGTHHTWHKPTDTAAIIDTNRMSSVFWIVVQYLEKHVLASRGP